MRDLLRLLLIAVMSFAVVGVAMVYSRDADLTTTMRTLGNSAAGIATTVRENVGLAGAAAGAGESSINTLVVPRPNAAQWVGLAGFPDQAEVRFPLPAGQALLGGALNLSFDTQLAEHGDGLLTLSVNDTPRGQVVLDSGRTQHQIRIDLTPADLVGDWIVLHMAGRGNTNAGHVCPSDNMGSAVTLTADSALELRSDRPIADAAQALAIAAQPLVLRPDGSTGDMALAIWANQALNRSGIAARIGQAGSGETPVTISQNAVQAAGVATGYSLAGIGAVEKVIAALGGTAVQPPSWPINVAELGAETVLKSFRGSRRWTIAFDAADLPGGALPEQFQLRLKTTPLAGDSDWMVRVSLNGSLISTRRLAGASETIALDVPLPANRMLAANVLTAELVDTTTSQGICSRGPDAQAQLLPESVLMDREHAQEGWAKLIEDLAGASDIGLETAAGVTLAQAARASGLLAMILPRKTVPRFDGLGAARLTVVGREGLARYLALPDAETDMKALVPPATSGNAAPVLSEVSITALGAMLERLGPDDVVVLISGV